MDSNSFIYNLDLINFKESFSKVGCKYSKSKKTISIQDLEKLKNSINRLMYADTFVDVNKQIDLCIKLLKKIEKAEKNEKLKLEEQFEKKIVLLPLNMVFLRNHYSNINTINDINLKTGFLSFQHETIEKQIGESLIEFITFDMDNYYDFILLFLNYLDCFKNILTAKEYGKIEFSINTPTTYVLELCKKYYTDKIKNYIKSKQNIFKNMINFIYNIDSNIDFKGLSFAKRCEIFNHIDCYKTTQLFSDNYSIINAVDDNYKNILYGLENTIDLNTLIEIAVKDDSENSKFTSNIDYDVKDIYTLFYISLCHLISNNKLFIKKCKNCNKYFLTSKNNIVYCDRIDIDSKKTCREIGNQFSQKRKENEEPVYKKYRQIYSKKSMTVNRNSDIASYKKNYEIWKEEATQFMKDIRKGLKTYEEFDKWLNDNN